MAYSIEDTERWFKGYVDTFRVDGELLPMQEVKRKHSRRVQKIASAIADSLGWGQEHDAWLAHAVGLLHDTARFEQERDYRTFADASSFDHGDRGAEILAEQFPWQGISAADREKILLAVRWHNKIALPTNLPLAAYRWCALIRDADKADVFRMVQQSIDAGKIRELLPRHPETTGLTRALIDEITKTRRGSYSNAHSLPDFRLIQLTWGLDLNYAVTVASLREEGIFRRIAEDLKGMGADDLVATLMSEIDKM